MLTWFQQQCGRESNSRNGPHIRLHPLISDISRERATLPFLFDGQPSNDTTVIHFASAVPDNNEHGQSWSSSYCQGFHWYPTNSYCRCWPTNYGLKLTGKRSVNPSHLHSLLCSRLHCQPDLSLSRPRHCHTWKTINGKREDDNFRAIKPSTQRCRIGHVANDFSNRFHAKRGSVSFI